MLMRHHVNEAARKQRREFRQIVGVAPFLDVLQIVEAETDDLAGARYRQRICEAGERPLGRRGRAPGNLADRPEVAVVLAEHRGEIIRHRGAYRLQVDDPIALDAAEPQALLPSETDNFHKMCSMTV